MDQTGGTITALELVTSSDGGTDLTSTAVSFYHGLNSGSGAISLSNDSPTLTLSDLTGAGYAVENLVGDVSIDTTGSLTIDGDVNNDGFRTTLAAGGVLDQTGGTITALELVTSSDGGTDLTSTAVAFYHGLNTGSGNLSISNDSPSLTLADLTSSGFAVENGAGDVSTATTFDLGVDSDVSSGGSALLTAAAGSIVQSAAGDVTAGGADVAFLAGTDILLGFVGATGGVVLTATAGSIVDANDGAVPDTLNISAGADSSLSAAGTIGVGDCIEVAMIGTLTVAAGAQVGGISVELCGTVFPSGSLTVDGTPPGIVLFNGVDQAPPGPGPALAPVLADHEPHEIDRFLQFPFDYGLLRTLELLLVEEGE
jgi:hypothetical protein